MGRTVTPASAPRTTRDPSASEFRCFLDKQESRNRIKQLVENVDEAERKQSHDEYISRSKDNCDKTLDRKQEIQK